MVSPAITIAEPEPLCSALRVLTAARVDAACVVNGHGTLVGVLARRDALRVYLRDDSVIRSEVERALFGQLPQAAGFGVHRLLRRQRCHPLRRLAPGVPLGARNQRPRVVGFATWRPGEQVDGVPRMLLRHGEEAPGRRP
ncbi:CBS domain-containing protein [Lentzea atacamensis]|uniref:CBS domain-containing protein n=1 Tax=Lentzea atacamensis TaxID=531938 RepID=UPI000D6CDD95